MNHAVHQIDLFLWMMGLPDEVLSSRSTWPTKTPRSRTSPRAS